MWSSKQRIILGPPGTGKTTRLIGQVEQELAAGVPPNRIAFLSFTKKATEEAMDRAIKRFGFKKSDLPHFKTVHAAGFNQQGLKRDDMMGFSHYRELGKILHITFSNGKLSEEGVPDEKHRGDRYTFLDSFARARCITPEAAWSSLTEDEDLDWFEFKLFQKTLQAFKREKGLMDFTDILEEMARRQSDPGVDVTIIDEAQDLSTLQWRAVEGYRRSAKRIFIGGDDDQAIYAWSGADVNYFLSLKGEQEVLSQSWRLPQQPFGIADGIANQIGRRFPKTWRPREERGAVHWHNTLESIDLSQGSWLLLGRNTHLLSQLVALTREQGFAYTYRGDPVVKQTHLKAIQAWEHLRKGNAVPTDVGKLVLSFMPWCKTNLDRYTPKTLTMADLKIEFPRIWHTSLTGIPEADRDYYLALLRSGESITKNPRIHINTIHGVKGGEADNVLLLPDMAQRSFSEYQRDADNEHRVFYVGASRCRQELNLINPMTNKFYLI